MNIVDFIKNRQLINQQTLSIAQKTLLRAIYGLPLSKSERRIFRKCTGLRRYKPQAYKEAVIISGRRSGKSNEIASNVAVHEAVAGQHERHLSVGERATVLVLATTLRQAKITFGYILGKLKSSKILSRMIESETQEQVNLNNRISIGVWACNESIRGLSVCVAVLDELAYFKHEGKLIDKQIVDSVRPSLIQFPNSKLIKISSPSKKAGVLYEDWKHHYGQSDDVLIWQSSSDLMNPAVTKKFIQQELRKDPAYAKSEYMAQFRDDLQDFIPPKILDESIVAGRLELPFIPSMRLVAFCDLSGGVRDDMALSICGLEESGQIVQCAVKVVPSPCDPSKAVKLFSETLKAYGSHSVIGDKYSAGWCVSAFQRESIMYQHSELNKSELYLNFLPLIMQGRVKLLDHKEQAIQFRQLERRSGKLQDIVDHPRGLKDDISNACAGSVLLASKTDEAFTLAPSLGLVEDDEGTLEERLDKESRDWLLGKKKKEKDKDEPEIDESFWDLSRMDALDVQRECDEIEGKKGKEPLVKFFKN
ncbi:hypothetical protein ES703_85697 [subsurface metagenome]